MNNNEDAELFRKIGCDFMTQSEFKAGDHGQFCKAKAVCQTRTACNLKLAKYDFKMPDTLEDAKIAAILPKGGMLVSWANRRYTDEGAVTAAVQNAGFDPFEKKLLGITAMTSLLGKTKFNELLGDLVEKPQGNLHSCQRPISDRHSNQQKMISKNKENKIMPNFINPTRVITGINTRWSYVNVWVPKSIDGASLSTPFRSSSQRMIQQPWKKSRRPFRKLIIVRSEVYPGVYGRASISFYAFNASFERIFLSYWLRRNYTK